MNRLVILDPGLITVLSHNYSEANALVREAGELGLRTELFCHRDAHRPVLEIPARPHFQQLSYSHMAESRPAADFMAIQFCNQSTLQDLEALRPELGADDFVFFPTVTCNIVLAIAHWYGQFPHGQAPWLGLCLMFPPDTSPSGRTSSVAWNTCRQAFARIPTRLAERIVYTCETRSVAADYEPLLGLRPLVLPIPTRAARERPRREAPREVRIAFLGGARAEKGFHLLPEIVGRVRERHPEVRFTIQATGFEGEFVREVTRRLETHADLLTVLDRPLSDDELMAALRSSSLLLLPYDPVPYRKRGSSLFTEARRLGVPMILPADTDFGAEGRALGIAETFRDFTAEGIAAAVDAALRRRQSLSEAAMRAAQAPEAASREYLAVLLRRLGLLA